MNFAQIQKLPIAHTLDPIYTGNTVIGLRYKDGIIIACDTNLCYGSCLTKAESYDKIKVLNNRTFIGYSGEFSDMQETNRILDEMIQEDNLSTNYNGNFGPIELGHYLSSLHYYQRNKMNPLLNAIVCGGIDFNGDIILYNIDSFGTLLKGDYFATHMGSYFSCAIFRNEYPKNYKDLTKEKALEIISKCFEVLFYRHKSAGDQIQYTIMEKNGNMDPKIESGKFKLKTKWNFDIYQIGREQFYPLA